MQWTVGSSVDSSTQGDHILKFLENFVYLMRDIQFCPVLVIIL